MKKRNLSHLAVLVGLSFTLVSCGGTAATPTVAPQPTTAPTAMMAANTPTTAAMASTPTTAAMADTPTTAAMMGTTPTTGAMMGTTPTDGAMMGTTPTTGAAMSTPGAASAVSFTMHAQNGSGEDGTMTLTDLGNNKSHVSLTLKNAPANPQPAHIHKGTCAALNPTPEIPLTDVVNGKSETDITNGGSGDYAVNVHKSATEISTYVSCGDLSTANMVGGAGTTGTPGATTGTPGATMSGTPGAAMQMDPSKVGQELVDAYAGKYKGTKVTMFGPFTSDDEVKFNNSVKDFTAATGIAIQYSGSKEFETTINVRVEGGNPPDIADFPQPGLMSSIAKTGKIQDVSKWIKPEWLAQEYNKGYLDTATVQGASGKILGGIFQRINAKGLVWYPKKAFDAAGYKVPTTWAEQQTLMDTIVKDGDTPWCIGIESGTATGWPATDWLENIMLRTTSTDNYDKWTTGALPFTDPTVKNALKIMSDIWLNPKYVYGGTKQIVSTAFGDANKPMFMNPPKCWLENQGNFITSFYPKDAKAGVDYDFYYLPPIDAQYGKPVEFGGDLMSAFTDRPEVRAVMEWFSTYDGVKGWVKQGGALAPQKDSNLADYPSDLDRKVANTVLNATVVRFDGSDLMPGAVGAGTFWKGMTDYVSGTVDATKALEEIQAGWANVKK